MASYYDFAEKFESGMKIMEIVNEGCNQPEDAYRYKAYYDELKKRPGSGEWKRIERNTTYAVNKTENDYFDAGRTLINYKEINIRKGIEAYYPYIISNPHQYTVEEIEI